MLILLDQLFNPHEHDGSSYYLQYPQSINGITALLMKGILLPALPPIVSNMTPQKGSKSWKPLHVVNTAWRPIFLDQNSLNLSKMKCETVWDTNQGSSNGLQPLRRFRKSLSPWPWLSIFLMFILSKVTSILGGGGIFAQSSMDDNAVNMHNGAQEHLENVQDHFDTLVPWYPSIVLRLGTSCGSFPSPECLIFLSRDMV